MATFIQVPASQPVVYVPGNFSVSFVQRGFNPENVFPSKLQVVAVANPRPPYGQLWPR